MKPEHDIVTEVELGEDIVWAFNWANTENWMSNLRYDAEQAGWDSQIGCLHGRGAPNDRAREAHAARGIEIPATYFCFDCGAVIDAADWRPRLHPPAPVQNHRTIMCDSDVRIVGPDGRSFLVNLDPNRVDYVTPDGIEVWAERKQQKVRYLDAFGDQVGPTHKNLVQAVEWAALNDWRHPSDPDWWNDQVIAQTKASAAGELGSWEGGWTNRPEAWVK